jgi:hypothetical protein
METKYCGGCKKDFPKTNEFFHAKTTKQKLKNGTVAIYQGFRSVCKKCHVIKSVDRCRKKRCKELGCSLDEYESVYRAQRSLSKMKYTELIDIPTASRGRIIRRMDNGYVFTTPEQYKIDWRKDISSARRKYDYGEVDFVTRKMAQAMQTKHLTKARLALGTNFSANDLPEDIYELKKTIILLKRELKQNNVKIR